MNQGINIPIWWRSLHRLLLILTMGISFICLISFWSLKSSSFANYFTGIISALFGHDSLGQALGVVVIHTFSFYAILFLLLLSIIGMLIGAYLKYPLKEYAIIFTATLILSLHVFTYG